MSRTKEAQVKEQRLRQMMAQQNLDAVVITRQNNFAWLTAGGDNHVVTATEYGACSIVFTPTDKYIVTTNIEAGRIATEEVAGLDYTVIGVPWHQPQAYQDKVQEIVSDVNTGSDNGEFDMPNIADKIDPLRYSLLPQEVEKYRTLGKDVEVSLNLVCHMLRPGMSEHEVAAILSQELYQQGITPAVLLIAADDRINKYRHPINTDNKIERMVMLVACGRRHGLIASITRLVHFGAVPQEIQKKHRAVVEVDTVLNMETTVGTPIGDIFQKGVDAYAAQGFADEWQLHHQGGPTGYAGRDFLAAFREQRQVEAFQAFAWNPSITGTKSEDTIIATPDGPEFITQSTNWPMIEVEYNGQSVLREDILSV